MLTCGKCKKEKPKEKFYKNASNKKRGYSYHCKQCADSYDTSANSRKTSKAYYERNKAKSFAKSAMYRARKLRAAPVWLTDEMKEEINLVYRQAKELGGCHVDHIVPLKGENVCGLHVPWNLQILTAKENLVKSNKELV